MMIFFVNSGLRWQGHTVPSEIKESREYLSPQKLLRMHFCLWFDINQGQY